MLAQRGIIRRPFWLQGLCGLLRSSWAPTATWLPPLATPASFPSLQQVLVPKTNSHINTGMFNFLAESASLGARATTPIKGKPVIIQASKAVLHEFMEHLLGWGSSEANTPPHLWYSSELCTTTWLCCSTVLSLYVLPYYDGVST